MVPRSVLFTAVALVSMLDVGGTVCVGIVQPAGDGERARTLVAAARRAIGGQTRLTSVRGLHLEGQRKSLRLTNAGLRWGTQRFDLKLLRPDKFLVTTTDVDNPKMGAVELRGLDGNELLNDSRPLDSTIKSGDSWGPQHLEEQRDSLARWLLLLLIAECPARPLTFSYAGVSQVIGREGQVLEVHSQGGFAVRLVLDEATSRPLAIRVQERRFLPSTTAAAPDRDRPQPPAEGGALALPVRQLVEVTLRLEDYRTVDGVWLPHRIVVSAGETALEEIALERVAINPGLTSASFKK